MESKTTPTITSLKSTPIPALEDSWMRKDTKIKDWITLDAKKTKDAWSGTCEQMAFELDNLSLDPTILPHNKRVQNHWHVKSRDKGGELGKATEPMDVLPKNPNPKVGNMAEPKPVRYHPTVWVTHDRAECDYLIKKYFLSDQNLRFIALDMEGNTIRTVDRLAPSTVQISTFKVCIIIQLYRMISKELSQLTLKLNQSGSSLKDCSPIGIPNALAELLGSTRISKIGFGTTMDKKLLEDHYSGAKVQNHFDMGDMAEALAIPTSLGMFSLLFAKEKIYAEKHNKNKFKVWKEHEKRHWDRKTLTPDEIYYASRDVFGVLTALRGFVRGENPSIFTHPVNKSKSVFDIILLPEVEEECVGIETLQPDGRYSYSDNSDHSQGSDDDLDPLEAFQRGRVSFG